MSPNHPAQQARAEQQRRIEQHAHDLAATRTWMAAERAATEKDETIRCWTWIVGLSTSLLVWTLIAWCVREMFR